MLMQKNSILFLLLCAFIALIGASKCPEARKPHVTSCTIFYNCINLPEGGYVWAPAKCSDGLVFQPYLRMCVLPGDTWTCEDQSTESSPIIENHETPELIDPAQTSYLGYTQDSSPFTGGTSIKSSYPVDGVSELGNLRLSATPYPVIEIVETDDQNSNDDNTKHTKNLAEPQAFGHRVENYLYQFFNSQQRIATKNNDKRRENNFTWLKGFINKMLLYENVGDQSKQHVLAPSIKLVGTTCEPPSKNSLKKNDNFSDINSDVMRYLVRSYILGTRKSMIANSKKKTKKPETTTIKTTEISQLSSDEMYSMGESIDEQESSTESIIDGLKADNNIIAIKGNLGGKEYVTIAKYKSLSARVNVEIIGVVVCAKGIRLPNRTDCTKYYTCDPETATLVEFSCSSKTAFNDYNRVCEAQMYKACTQKRLSEHQISTPSSIKLTKAPDLNVARMEDSGANNFCQSAGKFVDPSSENHYYVCYSSVGNSGIMDSVRMTCPNDLIFCQEKKVCTARKRCYE